MYQALYRKYRSKTFDDVVGQAHITETLKSQVESGKLSHAYLFTGTRGTGKTSCAKILSRAVNCENPQNGNPCNECPSCLGIESGAILDVLEIDAASNNGVDNVRALRDEAIYSPVSVKKRVYIIDEVHMLSGAAFNALLKIMEEPPEHLMFILATTELNKVPATILSRCQRYSFRRIGQADIESRLRYIASKENISIDDQALSLLARMADGALRDAISLLDQCAAEGGELTAEGVYASLGLAGNIKTAELMRSIALGEVRRVLEVFDELYKAGKDISALLGELVALGRDVLITMTSKRGLVSPVGSYDDMTLQSLAESFTVEGLVDIISQLQATLASIARSSSQRIEAEMCLIRICDASMSGDLPAITARVSKLERRLDGVSTGEPRGAFSAPVVPTAPTAPAGRAADLEESEALTQEADAPMREENTPPPPWDDEPPPERESERMYEAPAEPRTPVSNAKKANPADKKQKSDVTPSDVPLSVDSELSSWPDILNEIRADVSIMEFVYLSNPEMVKALYDGNVITLSVNTDFILNVINNDEVISAVKDEARRQLGADINVKMALASSLKTKGKDNLARLIERAGEYDNIKIN